MWFLFSLSDQIGKYKMMLHKNEVLHSYAYEYFPFFLGQFNWCCFIEVTWNPPPFEGTHSAATYIHFSKEKLKVLLKM